MRVCGYFRHFSSEFSLVVTPYKKKSYNNSETAVYEYNPTLFLSSFGVVMSCKVNFHVVRTALQYSAGRMKYVYLLFLLIGSL